MNSVIEFWLGDLAQGTRSRHWCVLLFGKLYVGFSSSPTGKGFHVRWLLGGGALEKENPNATSWHEVLRTGIDRAREHERSVDSKPVQVLSADESGSMDAEDLKVAMNEIEGIMEVNEEKESDEQKIVFLTDGEQVPRRLFKMNDVEWTPEAGELADEIDCALSPIMNDWVNKGYSLREIAHVMTMEIGMLECAEALDQRSDRAKKEI